MRERMKTLERLASLYRAVERTNGLTLDQARVAVHFAETKIREHREFLDQLNKSGLEALSNGEHSEWLIDQSQMECTGWNAQNLLAWRDKREAQRAAAAEMYRASRMQLEQMERVLRDLRTHLHLEDERSEQRASDDRFISRKRWLQQRSKWKSGC